MKDWKINLIYKFTLFIVLLISPFFLLMAEKNTDVLIQRYIQIYILELVILAFSYFLYEIRLRGYYNKLIKKTLKVNEKFHLSNKNYKKFMGLDSFNTFEYFFNEELDKLYAELEKYKNNYDEIKLSRNEDVKIKEERLHSVEQILEDVDTERKLSEDFLARCTDFLEEIRQNIKYYDNFFEELNFYMKKHFFINNLLVIKKEKDNYLIFKNLDSEKDDIKKENLYKLDLEGNNFFINNKLNYELNYDVICRLKVENKNHGYIFFNLNEKIFSEKTALKSLLEEVFEILRSIIDLYYQLSQKDKQINKLNDDIYKLKTELRETDENLDIHLEQMSNMYEEIVTLYEIGKKIGKIYDKNNIEKAILDTLLEITETEFALIYYYDKNKLNISKIINLNKQDIIDEFEKNNLLEKLFLDMKKAEKAIIINEISKLENYKNFPKIIKMKIRNFVEAPIIIGQEIKGGVILFNKNDDFTAANVNLITSLINQMSISVQNIDYFKKEIDREKEEEQLKIASQIQSSLFPQKMPELENLSFYGLNLPAKAVGGDYYDLVEIGNGKVVGFIADVSGKGIPASLLVNIVRTIFRMLVEEFKEYSPEKILTRINNMLLKENLEGRFVTAICFLVDNINKTIEISNAGHDPFLFYVGNEKEIKKYSSDSIVLGVMEEVYEKEKLSYENGDIFLFYTDGVAEARKNNGDFFTLERVERILKDKNNLNAEELINEIYSELKNFVEDAVQNDDITLLAIKGGNNERG